MKITFIQGGDSIEPHTLKCNRTPSHGTIINFHILKLWKTKYILE